MQLELLDTRTWETREELANTIFESSATMANVIALLCQVRPGEEVFGHELGHLFRYEAGGGAALAGAVLTGLPGDDGWFPGSLVRDHAQLADSMHQPRTRLVVVENTHNTAGGRTWPLPQTGCPL
jgi:threonine aldolase